MRLSLALTFAAVAACGGGEGSNDADADACPPAPDESARCGATCGNGQIDTCWFQAPWDDACPRWVMSAEECDGQATGATCEQLGYYGGATACGLACRIDEGDCRSCAPGLTCAGFGTEVTDRGAAVNGSRVALLSHGAVSFVDGLAVVATRTFDGPVGSVVGVPDGWLVAHGEPARITVTNLDGQVMAVETLAANQVPRLAYGPGGRVLLAWSALVPGVGLRISVAIAGADATIVVPGATLFDAPTRDFATATDGTSFFVAANGRLARIAADGTTAVNTAFPAPGGAEPAIHLTWSGTTGWYVATTGGTSAIAQRFDAAGTPVGAPVALALDRTLVDAVADGDDLLLLEFVNEDAEALTPLTVKRLSADGTYGTPVEVGVGLAGPRMLMRANELVVTWETRLGGALAIVTPP